MDLRKNKTNSLLTAIVITAVISGCQSSGSNDSASDAVTSGVVLAPAEKPAADAAGTEIQALRNGKPVTYSVTAVDGDTYSGMDNDGCSYTELAHAYAPSLEWENCNGSTGTQTITKIKGSPWPMTVGSKFSYKFRGSDNNDRWAGLRKCVVVGTENVATQMGEFDTYKVECKDPWSKRSWWYAPEIGRNVKSSRRHFTNSSRNHEIETIKVMPG